MSTDGHSSAMATLATFVANGSRKKPNVDIPKWWKMQCAERPIGSAFSGGAICKNFMFFLQGAKGFYDLLLISALFFCFFIRRSKTADLVQNLVYIILARFSPRTVVVYR